MVQKWPFFGNTGTINLAMLATMTWTPLGLKADRASRMEEYPVMEAISSGVIPI
jgi:hypothetical protein